jgi:hypothetical protein
MKRSEGRNFIVIAGIRKSARQGRSTLVSSLTRLSGPMIVGPQYTFSGGYAENPDIDPFAYLRDVLARLSTHPADRLPELLPDAWLAAHPRARRKAAS